jgi:hypothetical protein
VAQGQATCLQAKQLVMPLHPSYVLWDQGLLQVSRHRNVRATLQVGFDTPGGSDRACSGQPGTLLVANPSPMHVVTGKLRQQP